MAETKKVKDALKRLRDDLKQQTKESDKEKIRYLYFEKVFSFKELEQFFRGKYSYSELRNIVRDMYKDYYEKEKNNG